MIDGNNNDLCLAVGTTCHDRTILIFVWLSVHHRATKEQTISNFILYEQ